jgi:hypothetical protein
MVAFVAVAAGDGEETTGPEDSASGDGGFVGLVLDDAAALAESQDRPWRIRREDTEQFLLTDDLISGRVTFEVDGGIVTVAEIEVSNTDPPGGPVVEDTAAAELIASGLFRLLTVDNSFGGADVFADIRVARSVGSDGDALAPLELELIASTLSELGSVRFIDDADAEINALFDALPAGVAVVVVQRIDLLDDHAELELRLWCGSLCGVFLTYGAGPTDGGWEITGTIGPIAVS